MAWNLGRLAAVRRARALIERAESARVAVLEERTRIARETHDIVAHSLAVIVRQAEGGAFVAERDPARAVQTLQTIAEAGRVALTDMRGVLGYCASRSPVPRRGPPWPTWRRWWLGCVRPACTLKSPSRVCRSRSVPRRNSRCIGSCRRD